LSTKQFTYKDASIADIVAHFHTSTRQSIYNTRQYYKNDVVMSRIIDEAYKQYKIDKILAD